MPRPTDSQSSNTGNNTETGEENYQVIPSHLTPDDADYKMDYPRRGRAIIFNHYEYDDGINLSPREGTNKDVERLHSVLTKSLEFEVVVHNDKSRHEIEVILQELCQDQNLKDEDCIAIFVLTHGNENNNIAAKDKPYPVNELWYNFTPMKCPGLAQKPKLFFVNACKGEYEDTGVTYRKTKCRKIDSSLFEYIIYRAPAFADFLVMYSTCEGYASNRCEERGTYFIQSLCDVLENENYRKQELKQILTIATRETVNRCDKYNNYHRQIPNTSSTLMRNVYFNPKN